MTRRRGRGLSPSDRKIWNEVKRSVTPLTPERSLNVPTDTSTPSSAAPPAPKPSIKPVPAAPADPKPRLKPKIAVKLPPEPPIRVDQAPSLTEQLDAAPLRMDRKAYQRLKRGKTAPESKLDLHGMTLAQAQPALARFLREAQSKGFRTVLVITGKGRAASDNGPIPERRGVLKHQVPLWLAAAPLAGIVQQVTEAHLRHGGTGAYYVRLRRIR